MVEKERRRHERYDTSDLHGSLVQSLDARVMNVSLAGLAVETPIQLPLDQKVAVRLTHGKASFDVVARVRWCRVASTERQEDGEVRPLFHAGLEFRNVLSESARELLAFLEESLVVDVETRLFGRLDMPRGEAVHLESDFGFNVRRIGMGGMLIDTDYPCHQGDEVDFELALAGRPFAGSARIVSVTDIKVDDDRLRLRYEIGVEFTRLPEESRRHLADYIRATFEAGTGEPSAG